MNPMGWIGGGIAGTGSAMQFMAQRRREKAQNKVAGNMKRQTAAFGQERYDISDTLRRALDSITQTRMEYTQDYFENRNSPERKLEAERERDERITTSQAGLNTALAALRGPSTAYRGADATLLPGDAVQGDASGMNPASAMDQSMQVYGDREQPWLQGVMDQLAAQGYLTGAAAYDTGNQQNLALNQRPLDNEALLRQLLTGVRQGEAKYVRDNEMAGLQRAMEAANRVGASEMLWGSILQNVGMGVAGQSSGFQYQSPNGANQPGNPNPGGMYGNPGDPIGGGYTTGDPGAGDLPSHTNPNSQQA